MKGVRLHRVNFGLDVPGPTIHADGRVSWSLRPLDLGPGMVVVSRRGRGRVGVFDHWIEAWGYARKALRRRPWIGSLYLTTYGRILGEEGGEAGQPYVVRRWRADVRPGAGIVLVVLKRAAKPWQWEGSGDGQSQ